MTRTTTQSAITALCAIVCVSCARSDTRPESSRATIATGPAILTFDVAKDGRIAYAKFVNQKSAIFVSNADGSGAHRVSFGVWDTNPKWSPDGKWISLTRDQGDQGDVIIVPADSGAETIVAATPAEEDSNGWMGDGSGLLFGRTTAVGVETWIYRMADGKSERLLNVDGSTDAYSSPDAKWIAYTLSKGGHSTLWLYDVEKKSQQQLTTDGFEKLGFAVFSPDSRSILFESRRTGTSDLWRADVATGKLTQLTQDVADDFYGRWSPDGSRIVFLSNRGGQIDVWTLSTGEADVQRVTDDAIAEVLPQWTADGRGILTSVSGPAHLYSIPVTGGPAVPLTSGDWSVVVGSGGASVNVGATVSPDGTQIAYSGNKNGDADIWIVPDTGGESRLLSGAPGFDGDAGWSPDGKKIAFTSVRGGNPDIWIVPASGGEATRLTNWPSSETHPVWSPDGKSIAFLSNNDSHGRDIWVIPASGGDAKRVTKIGAVASFSWSPDSRLFAFAAQTNGTGVYIVPATGGEPKRIAEASLIPQWSPDGREIKVSACGGGSCWIDIRSADGKLLRTLSASKTIVYETTFSWSHDGKQVLVGYEEYKAANGDVRIDLRPSAGGSTKVLTSEKGQSMRLVGFANGEKSVIGIGIKRDLTLQRIDAPAPKKP